MDGNGENHLEVRWGARKLAERFKGERSEGNLGCSLDMIATKKGTCLLDLTLS